MHENENVANSLMKKLLLENGGYFFYSLKLNIIPAMEYDAVLYQPKE